MNSILVYCWGATNEPSLIKYLNKAIPHVYEYRRIMSDYHADSEFSVECMEILEKEKIEAVFSFDYFPLLSLICSVRNIPYIAWIYDCPMLTLESLTLSNECNYIFCFDRLYTVRLINNGAKHCYHLPLAGDPEMLSIAMGATSVQKYKADISFVGNLYNDEKNRFRAATWDEYTAGFFEGIIEVQSKIYGLNLIANVLSEEATNTIVDKCNLQLSNLYHFDAKRLASDVINMEISARDRETVLDIISNHYGITLYTGSSLPEKLIKPNINLGGYVDYLTQMPLVFHDSKINLNITSRTIESGVPLRVLDILSCEGFCLTNYQPEIAALFEDGTDLVMYEDVQDLPELIHYYLTHDEERIRIAHNGYKKILEQYNYANSLAQIFKLISL